MNSSTKKADKTKMTVKNGKVYGDALSAEEKKLVFSILTVRRATSGIFSSLNALPRHSSVSSDEILMLFDTTAFATNFLGPVSLTERLATRGSAIEST